MKYLLILVFFVGSALSECKDEHKSCSDYDEECCPEFVCRQPRAGENFNSSNTRCFEPDDDDQANEETTPTSTTEQPCIDRGNFCDNSTYCCDESLECVPVAGTDFGICSEPETETTPTSTTETQCGSAGAECQLRVEDTCCEGLECQGNSTSLLTGACQQPTPTTTTQTTTTQEACRQRDQNCDPRRDRGEKCCTDGEELRCRRSGILRLRWTCQACVKTSERCRRSRDCCQNEGEEENVCNEPRRRGEPRTCGPRPATTTTTRRACSQRDGSCRNDRDCCRNQNLYCQPSNSTTGETSESSEETEGTCQLRPTTTTSSTTTTTSTTQSPTTTTTPSSTTQGCTTEGQNCQETSSCCQGLECTEQLIIVDPILNRKTCQRPTTPTTTTSTTTSTTTEGTTTTTRPIVNNCSARGGLCPSQKDEECCPGLKCVSVNGGLWQCGDRGSDGTK